MYTEKILTKCIDCGEEIEGFRNKKRCYKCAALAQKKSRAEYVKRRTESILNGDLFVPRRTIYEKICTICGCEFRTPNTNTEYCHGCIKLVRQHQKNQTERAERKQRKINEILKKCAELNISYGKYKEMERDGKL